MKKLSIEQIKEAVFNKGYTLIDTEYINNSKPITFSDDSGYIYHMTYMSFRTCVTPDFINKSNPYSLQNIKLWCQKNIKNFILMSNKYEGASKHLQWKCLDSKCGEVFSSSWNNVLGGKGCSYCARKRVGKFNCLANQNPELAKEWHPTKNGELTPFLVTLRSNRNVWWKCKNNHEWESVINNRNRKNNGCPYCSGRKVCADNCLPNTDLQLMTEWHPTLNYNLNPFDYTRGMRDKVWWKCEKGHEWEATIYSRAYGIGCPYCAGQLPTLENNLLKVSPKLCEEWNYNKNKNTPDMYTANSGKTVWWKCNECNYEWETQIYNRNHAGTGCPSCSNSKLETLIEEFCKHNGLKYKQQFTFNSCKSNKKYKLRFDFAILNKSNQLISLIEANGIQHYEPVDFFGGEDKFILQQKNDNIKMEYCNTNKIPLLIIPYWEKHNIESILIKELQPLLTNNI